MAIWDDTLTERDKEVFAKSGYGSRAGFGQRPAVLVIDMNYNFVGDRPEPILKSIERFRNSCGEEGWEGVYHIRELLDGARKKHLPIFYTTAQEKKSSVTVGRWQGKNRRAGEDLREEWSKGNEIVEEIAPQEGEIVVRKQKPSAFFGTALMSMLNEVHADSVLVTGCTTSGCVRASVIDAFSYNFRVSIVEECVFDRGQASHKINLFDMNAKYADVIPLREALEYINGLPDTLYAPGL
ncbi:MAG: isochorismatase family protein [Deltaproteobacteria bacterium]|nr:isochorismatase family protein [Deltaproteobacteria bacterium]MCZ6624159.1 isochorismatase family protein [Deltaproteobacteria bacterium]